MMQSVELIKVFIDSLTLWVSSSRWREASVIWLIWFQLGLKDLEVKKKITEIVICMDTWIFLHFVMDLILQYIRV